MNNQRGSVVLITTIMILVLMTAIGIMGMKRSIREVKDSRQHLVGEMNFYAAEGGLTTASIEARKLALEGYFTEPTEPFVTGVIGSSKYSVTVDLLPEVEPITGIHDFMATSRGTHKRGRLKILQARYRWEPPFMLPEVALWVGGDLISKNNANAVDGVYVEDGVTYDIMCVGDSSEYDGAGAIAPTAKEIWISDRLFTMPFVEFDDSISTYGDDDHMQFVVSNGDLAISNETGAGLLYVKGNLVINGDFNWHGVVYVEGNVEYHGGGSNNCSDKSGSIWGSLVVKGNTDMQNGDVCYDGEYLKKLSDGLSHFRRLWWREQQPRITVMPNGTIITR